MDDILLQVARLSLPLVLAALSETISERGGVVNLGVEGMMLAGSLVAYLVAAGEGGGGLAPAWFAAMAVGASLGVVVAFFTVQRRADQIVTGTAVHFLCLGATGLLFERFKGQDSVTTFAQVGGLVAALPYVATLGLVAAMWVLFDATGPGRRLRAAGENPEALRAEGGSPRRSRWLAVVLAGALAGLAGATLTTVLTGEFVEGMTGGRGFLALALVLFARWHPLGALIAGSFLGGAFVLELHLSTWAAGSEDRRWLDLLVFALHSSPYVLTVVALAVVGRRPSAPQALGKPA